MKNFTKKRGLFAAAAALLVITAMFVTTGCGNELGEGNGYGGYNDGFIPPPGKGAVRLNFNEKIENARTILPDLPAGISDISDFDRFVFQFTPSSAPPITKTVLQANLYDYIILDPGTYDLIVIGYVDFSLPQDGTGLKPIAANADSVEVEITAAKVTNKTIVLKPIDDPDIGEVGTGTFAYTISFAPGSTLNVTDIVSATLTLSDLSGAALSTVDGLNVKDKIGITTATSISVDAGYYFVDFKIKAESTDEVPFKQIVFIAKNLTSTYEFIFDRDYFYGTLQIRSSHADLTFEAPTDYNPDIIYTTYTPPSGDTLVDLSNESYTTGDVIEVKRGQTLTLTVVNDSDYTANSFVWFCLNSIANNTKITTIVTATGDYSVAKTYFLTVVGFIDGIPYSSEVKFKVVP